MRFVRSANFLSICRSSPENYPHSYLRQDLPRDDYDLDRLEWDVTHQVLNKAAPRVLPVLFRHHISGQEYDSDNSYGNEHCHQHDASTAGGTFVAPVS